MPGGDKTGPLGQGPLTGRGAGFCRGNNMPGFANRVGGARGGMGRGSGFGAGGHGRGCRKRFFSTGVPGRVWFQGGAAPYVDRPVGSIHAQERQYLEEQAGFYRSELDQIERRLTELKNANKEA